MADMEASMFTFILAQTWSGRANRQCWFCDVYRHDIITFNLNHKLFVYPRCFWFLCSASLTFPNMAVKKMGTFFFCFEAKASGNRDFIANENVRLGLLAILLLLS